ncbi:MAG TPA: hypothetical protein VN851_23035 [Thermoanaerobaculia bacterium]|nr:hypothetical protein [Thermoanaerobaculia bacterium]
MTTSLSRSLPQSLLRPAFDAFRGLDRLLDGGVAALVRIFLGLALGWFLYVPIHELLHAGACLAAGGHVERLEIDGMYGGALLAKVFPFVVSGSEYAGRLSGFDTGGSDLVYLATDFGPFLLTLFPGVWLLRRAVETRRSFLFGLSLPLALAPFISLTGDAYEIGSILTTRLGPWADAASSALLRGDDAIKKFGELRAATETVPWAGFGIAIVLGFCWAEATFALGALIARKLGQRSIEPRSLSPKKT